MKRRSACSRKRVPKRSERRHKGVPPDLAALPKLVSVSFESGIDAPDARASARHVKEDEAVEHGDLPSIFNGPEPFREVSHEIGEDHFAARDEGHVARKEAHRDKQPSEELDDPGHAVLTFIERM